MLRIFLSSTFQDLIAERKAVEYVVNRIGLHFLGMEHFGSRPGEPLIECLKKVRESDYFILVVSDRYGFIPEGQSKSITHLEYSEARDNNIPVLAYIAENADYESSKHPLSIELSDHHVMSPFGSADDLAWKVASDLAREVGDRRLNNSEMLRTILAKEIEERNSEFIDLLRFRACRIIELLEKAKSQRQSHRFRWLNLGRRRRYPERYTLVASDELIQKFRMLHERHVEAIAANNMILAHEIFHNIQAFFEQIEWSEFSAAEREVHGSRRVVYSLDMETFKRGPLMRAYAAHDGQGPLATPDASIAIGMWWRLDLPVERR